MMADRVFEAQISSFSFVARARAKRGPGEAMVEKRITLEELGTQLDRVQMMA